MNRLDGVLGQTATTLCNGVVAGMVNWTSEWLAKTFRLSLGEVGEVEPCLATGFNVGRCRMMGLGWGGMVLEA